MTATPDIIPTDLTLEIDSDIAPERFMTAARAFFGYVQELSRAFAPEGDLPHWVVRVKEGSTLLAIDPTPAVPAEVVNVILTRTAKGIGAVAEGGIEESGLPEEALRHLRTLAELAEGTKARPITMRVWVRKHPITISPAIARAVREDLRADYSDYGTIEGRLETIAESHGSLQFMLRDPMLRQKVRCYFPEELLLEVFATFRKRVEVAGVIHYRRNGVAMSIDAERIYGLPDDSELPTAEDVRGILRS